MSPESRDIPRQRLHTHETGYFCARNQAAPFALHPYTPAALAEVPYHTDMTEHTRRVGCTRHPRCSKPVALGEVSCCHQPTNGAAPPLASQALGAHRIPPARSPTRLESARLPVALSIFGLSLSASRHCPLCGVVPMLSVRLPLVPCPSSLAPLLPGTTHALSAKGMSPSRAL